MKHSILALSVASALAAFAASASAVTVNFTDEEAPGVTCCGLMASDAYAAQGLTVDKAYWYPDSRDTFDGEYGGLWRRNGRPPQSLAGVGFTAQGNFVGSHYRITDAAVRKRVFELVKVLAGPRSKV